MRPLPLIAALRAVEGQTTNMESGLILMEIGLYVVVGLYIWYEVQLLREMGTKAYLSDMWTPIDVLNLFIFVVVFILRVSFLLEAHGLRDDLDAEAEFVNLTYVAHFFKQVENLNALNAVLCFVKVFRYLRPNKQMAQFTDTLAYAAAEMLVLSFIIFIILTGYGLAFLMGFGDTLENYKSFPTCLLTLFRAVLGDFEVQELGASNRYVGRGQCCCCY